MPDESKLFLTTSQAAKLLCVCPATVSKLFDRGLLKGYVLPLAKRTRRISRESVDELMRNNGYPTDDQLASR